jgi:hypothetical protein
MQLDVRTLVFTTAVLTAGFAGLLFIYGAGK